MRKNLELKNIVNGYFQGQINRKDLDKAIEVFSDPYHNLDLRPIIYQLWETHDANGEISLSKEENQILLDKIHHNINLNTETNSGNKTRTLAFKIIKIAAVFVIGLVLGVYVNGLKRIETAYHKTIVPQGAISQVILDDGSVVYLNAGTELKYPTNKDSEREVFLTGEAWFDVKSNEDNPFLVHTPFYRVKVTGTKFNIKAYQEEDKVITTLEEGRIEILSSDGLKLKGHRILHPGDQLTYNVLDNSIHIKKVNPRLFSSWKDNQLIFINMNLRQLIVLLERKYGVNIETSDQSILDYHYDGTISKESILEVLDLIRATLPVNYKIEEQTIIIERK